MGYGILFGGAIDNGTAELKKASGSTTFFNLNFGLGPLDLLAGYRMWDTTHKYQFPGNPELEKKLKYNEIGVGVGFGF